MKKLVIMLPALNEEEKIGGMIKKIMLRNYNFDEVVCLVVNDGSDDDTAKRAKEARATVVSHNKNMGVGKAFSTGLSYSLAEGADVMVNIDADGQFDPSEINNLLLPLLDRRADFVTGDRFSNGRPNNMSQIKYYGNICMSFLISLLVGEKFRDVSCGFRAYNREAMLKMNLFGVFTYTQETFLDLKFKGLNIASVPVRVKYFKGRKSRVVKSIFNYAFNSMNIILRSIIYYKPLKFFSYPGIVFSFIGFLFIIFLLYHRIVLGSFSPFKAFGFIGGAFVIFGFLLIMTGLLADIIDRIRINQENILYLEKKRMYNN